MQKPKIPTLTTFTNLRLLIPLLVAAATLLGGCSKEAAILRRTKAGDEFFASRQYEKAELEYLNLLQLKADSTYAMSQIGLIYLQQGRLGRAHPYLYRVRELDPDNLQNRIRLATVMLAVGNKSEANKEAEFVFSRESANAEAPLILAETAMSTEAIGALRARLLGLSDGLPSSAPVLTALGMLAVRDQGAVAAETLYDAAVKADANFAAAYVGLASLFSTQGDFQKAEESLQKAAQLSGPRSPRSVQYAVFKYKLGEVKEARSLLENLAKEAPDYIPALVRLAEVAVAQDDFAEAEQLLKTILRQDPTHPEALTVKSRLLAKQGDFKAALAQLDVLLRMYPQSAEAHLETARVHLASGDEQSAINSLTLSVLYSPNLRSAVVLLAELNMRRGNIAEAMSSLRQFLQVQPNAVDAYALLAEGYRIRGEWQDSMDTLAKIDTLVPSLEDTALRKGVLLFEQSKLPEAREVFLGVIERNPVSLPALERLYDIEGWSEAGLARVNRALALDQGNAALHLLLAKIYIKAGKNSQAREHLEKALSLDAKNAVAHIMLVKIALDGADVALAKEHLKIVVQLNSKDSGAWFLLAGLQQKDGEYVPARDAYAKVLELSPNYVPALSNLAYLFSEFLEQKDRAYELGRQARDLAPGDGKVAEIFGRILQKRGEYLAAVAPLKEALARQTESADVRYYLGFNSYMLGEESAATEFFNAALADSRGLAESADARSKLVLLGVKLDQANLEATEAILKARLKESPKDPVALRKWALVLNSRGKPEAAIEVLKEARTSNPQNAVIQFSLARLLQEQGKLSEAVQSAWSARRIAPDDLEGAWTLAELTWATGDFVSAYNLYTEVSRKREKSAQVWFSLSEAAIAVGKLEEGERALRHALTLAPNAAGKERISFIQASLDSVLAPVLVADARRKLEGGEKDVLAAYLLAVTSSDFRDVEKWLNQCLLWSPEFAPAKRLFVLRASGRGTEYDQRVIVLGTQAREMYRNDPGMEKAIAGAVYRQGDYARVAALLEGVRTALQTDPEYHYYLGMSYFALGRRTQALDTLNQALAAGLNGLLAAEVRTALASLKPSSP